MVARTTLYPGEATYVWSPDYQRLPKKDYAPLFHVPASGSWRLRNTSTSATITLQVIDIAVRGVLGTEDH